MRMLLHAGVIGMPNDHVSSRARRRISVHRYDVTCLYVLSCMASHMQKVTVSLVAAWVVQILGVLL